MSFFVLICLKSRRPQPMRAAASGAGAPDVFYWISSLRLAGTALVCLGRVSFSTPSS